MQVGKTHQSWESLPNDSVAVKRSIPKLRLLTNSGRFGPGSFRPGSFRPGLFRPNFGVGRFGLGRWVDSALGRFGRSLYQNVDCLGLADKKIDGLTENDK